MNGTDAPADVRLGHVLLSLMRGLSDKALAWVAAFMVYGLTVYAVVVPDPWRFGAVGIFAAVMCPLWLRRPRKE